MPFPDIPHTTDLTRTGNTPPSSPEVSNPIRTLASHLPLGGRTVNSDGAALPPRREFDTKQADQRASRLMTLPPELLLNVCSSAEVATKLSETCQKGLQCARDLDVINFRVRPDQFALLMDAKGPAVRSLTLRGQFDDTHLQRLSGRLRHLELEVGDGVTPQGLGELLSGATNLQSLTLHDNVCTQEHLQQVPDTIRALTVTLPADMTTAALSQLLGRLGSLESLDIKGRGLTDDDLAALPQGLREVAFQLAPQTTPGALAGLRCPQLCVMVLDNTKLDEAQALAIAGIRSLKSLNLSDTGGGVTSAVARQLGLNPNLVELHLAFNNLDDDCVAELSRAQHELGENASLARIDLRWNRLTERSQGLLRAMPAVIDADATFNW
jgi:hypothetical protein